MQRVRCGFGEAGPVGGNLQKVSPPPPPFQRAHLPPPRRPNHGLPCPPMYSPSGSCSSLGGSSSRSSITHTSRSHIPHHLHCFQRSLDRPFSPWPRRLQISNSSRMITARSSARSRCV